MSAEAHEHLKRYSKYRFTSLYKLIDRIGPISFPERNQDNLVIFLARSIVGQQLSLTAARTIWGRINEVSQKEKKSLSDIFKSKRYGNKLRKCGVSGNKIKAIYSVSSYISKNNTSEEWLSSLSHEERASYLMNIWGVGQWTTDMVSLFYFNDEDIWPVSDVSIIRGYKELLKTCKRSIDFDSAEQEYRPYRSYLALYIWRGLDTGLITKGE